MKKVVLLLAIITLLATACTPAPRGEVIVYAVAPLSGWQANGGQTVLGGARTMAEQLTRQAGLLGSISVAQNSLGG